MKHKLLLLSFASLYSCNINKMHITPHLTQKDTTSQFKTQKEPDLYASTSSSPPISIEIEIANPELVLITQKNTQNSLVKLKNNAIIHIKKKANTIKNFIKKPEVKKKRSIGGIIAGLFIWSAVALAGFLVATYSSAFYGWILFGVGFLIFIICLIDLGYSIDYNSKIKDPIENKTEIIIDVVYLKNGGKIKGRIIEEKPNDSLKIETSDGSIFVFKYIEIDKITHEKKM